jgi:hypothetical protein
MCERKTARQEWRKMQRQRAAVRHGYDMFHEGLRDGQCGKAPTGKHLRVGWFLARNIAFSGGKVRAAR